MAYKRSILDQISDNLSPVIRKLNNIKNQLVGTKVSALRITETEQNLLGDKDFTYSGQIIDNVIINYPFSSIEIFSAKDTGSLDDTTLSLFDILPITMKIPFDDSGQAPVELDENDLIISALYDHHDNLIPIRSKVSRIYGSFFGRNQVGKHYELTLQRGDEADEIEEIIDTYLSGQLR